MFSIERHPEVTLRWIESGETVGLFDLYRSLR
ncbi:hypothetical protein J2W17_003488 [Pseudomonas lini]|nr:hypothetical protein [Pseudomonas lini]